MALEQLDLMNFLLESAYVSSYISLHAFALLFE